MFTKVGQKAHKTVLLERFIGYVNVLTEARACVNTNNLSTVGPRTTTTTTTIMG